MSTKQAQISIGMEPIAKFQRLTPHAADLKWDDNRRGRVRKIAVMCVEETPGPEFEQCFLFDDPLMFSLNKVITYQNDILPTAGPSLLLYIIIMITLYS